MKIKRTFLAYFGLGVLITLFLSSLAFAYLQKKTKPHLRQQPNNKYLAFINESYQIIKDNYWQKLSDEQLSKLFLAALAESDGQPEPVRFKSNLQTFDEGLRKILKELPPDKKEKLVAQIVDKVLMNLQPYGRSRLYQKRDVVSLENKVRNKTNLNYYHQLGVSPSASPQALNQAFKKKVAQLQKSQPTERKKKIKQLKQAYQTLSNPQSKKLYDQKKIATTVEGELITPSILHLTISRFSPTTLEDLKRVSQKFDHGQELDTLILDLRDNIGGAIDGLPYFLAPFIGPGRYAYSFLQQGHYQVFQTKGSWLPSLLRYKKVIILINHNTQSSAEVFAAALKKYNVGILMGEKTRGWGTVERVFRLKNQINPHTTYSIFLVHHLTLDENNQPIEGRGITLIINLKQPNWQKKFSHYYPLPNLIRAIEKVWQEE